MEAAHPQSPSPQSVGREFVRQYYTLLNKAPNHLHRFYNNHSSFTHDKSALVIGQKNIHSRIQQLNFHNCRAKITQVDAQATLGNGVVVQVTGELSNDGKPMRRFTQTFVLAAQSPKKYYVHNDIFRYHVAIEDNDIEDRFESEGKCKHDTIQSEQVATGIPATNKERQLEQQQVPLHMVDNCMVTANTITPQQSQSVHYFVDEDDARPITVLPVSTTPLGTNFANLSPNRSLQRDRTGQTNSVANYDEVIMHGNTKSSLGNPAQSTAVPQSTTGSVASDDIDCFQISTGKSSNHAMQDFSQTSRAAVGNYQLQQQQHPLGGIQTYANLFKSTPSTNNFINAAMHQQQQQKAQHHPNKSSFQGNSTVPSTVAYSARNNNNNSTNNSNTANENNSIVRQNNNCYQATSAQRPSSKTFNRDFDQRRTTNSPFSDNQQLFLGNIPHHAAEDDLKTLFSRFGTVLDLRILSKPPGKLPSGNRNPLNYGFITYKDVESVQNCLAHCPLYFPENSPDRQRLNVEEKKPRSRGNDLPTRQGMGGCASTDASGGNNKINNSQRNMNNNGPPPPRSLSNSGRGSGVGNNTARGTGPSRSRGGSSGPRMGNTFNRNDNRNSNSGNTGGGGSSHMRDGSNNLQISNNNYSARR